MAKPKLKIEVDNNSAIPGHFRASAYDKNGACVARTWAETKEKVLGQLDARIAKINET